MPERTGWSSELLVRSSLTTSEALDAVGRSMAAIEEDCADSWPSCPRAGLICDCRLRAVRACSTLTNLYAPRETTPLRGPHIIADPSGGPGAPEGHPLHLARQESMARYTLDSTVRHRLEPVLDG